MRNGLDISEDPNLKDMDFESVKSSSPKNRAMFPVTISELSEQPDGQVERRFELAIIQS